MNITFRRVRPLVIVLLSISAAGCVQQFMAPTIGAPDAPSTPLEMALQKASPLLLRRASSLGYHPQIVFCRGSGWTAECYASHALGYRPELYFCQSMMSGHISGTYCIPATHLAMTVQILKPPGSSY